ncbi:hypothetical protein B9Z55_013869 [Caenorhabditis nigoni]|uniref:Uncharacterized protein n=1 Tax=Caenorhabditis nigoni TaxID=1611254 RepID=A0A2G5U448_9PELO|nr:hypothetical protein B9Z55_013869 [Caenorhabditis nigoni]
MKFFGLFLNFESLNNRIEQFIFSQGSDIQEKEEMEPNGGFKKKEIGTDDGVGGKWKDREEEKDGKNRY